MIALTPLLPFAAGLVTAVAGAGILLPLTGAGAGGLQRLSTPLEDERGSLLRGLKELDLEHAGGLLPEEDYRILRAEMAARAVAILRTSGPAPDAGELAAAIRARTPASDRRSMTLPGVLVAVAIAVAALPILFSGLAAREPGGLITGDAPGGPAGASKSLEQRVREHPAEVGPRIELAQRYLDAGDVRSATEQYLRVVALDPRNVEANTKLGYLLYAAGLVEEGMRAVDRALEADPRYPDALYLKGAILFQALNRPQEAAAALRAYLAAAPFGSHRAEVEQALQVIERGGP